MNIGLREYKRARLRIAVALGLPEDMQGETREVIGVISDNRLAGEATALMWQTCAEADVDWITLILHPEPFAPGMDAEKLKRWYEKFGFEEIQAEPCLMARSPQPAKIARPH